VRSIRKIDIYSGQPVAQDARKTMAPKNARVERLSRPWRVVIVWSSMIDRLFNALGRGLIRFIQYLGEVVLLAADTFRSIFTHRLRWKLFLNQIVEIGLLSQLVVVITGAFTGAVFSAQTFFQFNKLGMGSAVGAVVSVAICRELGPVLTALMVTGRVGAAMSAEIGTMKVTEQIDALRALAVYPTDYLVVPRALAMMISMPLLVAECLAVGIAAGYFIAIFLLEINGTYYMANMVRWTRNRDIIMGLSKAFCFGILIVFISCHKGLSAREGAVGVGRATTEAVVNSSLAVLICNFFLTMLLNIIYPAGYQ
jgi:phospholipid/cholesterol/gamma-HCH transport system permease protein